jgi:hypothetical protein
LVPPVQMSQFNWAKQPLSKGPFGRVPWTRNSLLIAILETVYYVIVYRIGVHGVLARCALHRIAETII